MLACPRCSQPLTQKFTKDLIGEDEENAYECGQCGCEITFNDPTYCQATIPLPFPAAVPIRIDVV